MLGETSSLNAREQLVRRLVFQLVDKVIVEVIGVVVENAFYQTLRRCSRYLFGAALRQLVQNNVSITTNVQCSPEVLDTLFNAPLLAMAAAPTEPCFGEIGF